MKLGNVLFYNVFLFVGFAILECDFLQLVSVIEALTHISPAVQDSLSLCSPLAMFEEDHLSGKL